MRNLVIGDSGVLIFWDVGEVFGVIDVEKGLFEEGRGRFGEFDLSD